MKQASTIFLKLAIILMGVLVLALCIFFVPGVAHYAEKLFPNLAYMKYLIFIDFYATAVTFYFALYQAFILLSYIDKNKAFSELSVTALKNIRNCAVTISGLYILGMPLYHLMAEADDAPGIILIGMGIIFASLVVAVFAAVPQKLLKNAIDMKMENDLSV